MLRLKMSLLFQSREDPECNCAVRSLELFYHRWNLFLEQAAFDPNWTQRFLLELVSAEKTARLEILFSNSTSPLSRFLFTVTGGLQAVTNLLPDCEVGIHGNQGLTAHCSARDNRGESGVSGWAFENEWMRHDGAKLLHCG